MHALNIIYLSRYHISEYQKFKVQIHIYIRIIFFLHFMFYTFTRLFKTSAYVNFIKEEYFNFIFNL